MILLFIVLIILIFSRCKTKNLSKNKTPSSEYQSTKQKSISAEYKPDLIKNYNATDKTQKLKVDSKYGVIVNLDTREILADKKSSERIFPASLTKIMTLIVAAENIKDYSDTYKFSSELLDPLFADEASCAGFLAGEKVTIDDLMYGCILPSGADGALGLAEYVAGSEKNFVKLMNKKVNELGLKDTHFMNVSGLHDKFHYSTARELAKITEYAMKNEKCKEVLSTYTYKTSKTDEHPDGIELYSTMFSRMYGDEAVNVKIIAGKTGYTDQSGNCLASYAENSDGERFILITTSANGSYAPIYDAINVYAKYAGNGKTDIRQEIVETPAEYYY